MDTIPDQPTTGPDPAEMEPALPAPVSLALDNYALECTNCERFVLGSDAVLVCECNSSVKISDAKSLLSEVSR